MEGAKTEIETNFYIFASGRNTSLTIQSYYAFHANSGVYP